MNRSKAILTAMALALLATPQPSQASSQYTNITISYIELSISDGCYYFLLTGVTEADPSVPGNPRFAIPNTGANAKEMYATLLSARASGTSITRVLTGGSTVCGTAQAIIIDF